MKPRPKPQDSGTQELFRAKLRNIINLQHELVRLGELIDWERLEAHFAPYYREAGRPGLAIRLVVGLHLLKHIEGLSDEARCAERWERDPVHAILVCGEEYFQHAFAVGAIGDDAFSQASGRAGAGDVVAGNAGRSVSRRGAQSARDGSGRGGHHRAGKSHRASDRARAAAHRDRTVGTARETSQAAIAAIVCARGAERGDEDGPLLLQPQQQKRRAKRQVKFLRVRLRRLIRDVRRKMAALPALAESSAQRLEHTLGRAWHIAQQQRGDREYVYSWHAPETECISKGKARAPYEFGCKVSIVTNLHPAKGGHFILQARALHGNPYDGHTLKQALDDVREMVGRSPLRVAVDQGYKGHRLTGHPHTAVYITGQRRDVTDKIKRWLKRRAVVEPIIGHAKNDGLLGRNWLKGRAGDRCNALLAAAGFNLRQLLRFLRSIPYFLRDFFRALLVTLRPSTTLAA